MKNKNIKGMEQVERLLTRDQQIDLFRCSKTVVEG